MLLSARMLNAVADVNTLDYIQTHQMTAGEQADVFFQLVDASKLPSTQYYFPAGLRYVPAAGSTLQCVLASIDDVGSITRYASQPFPTSDPSIWKLSLLSSDKIGGTLALQLTLNEGGVIRKGVLQAAVSVASGTQAFC